MREAEFRKRFGERVAAARLAQAIAQETLAERAGISRNEVSLIERGAVTCSIHIAARLASALGVGLDVLAGTSGRGVTPAFMRISEIVRNMPSSEQERWAGALGAYAGDDLARPKRYRRGKK